MVKARKKQGNRPKKAKGKVAQQITAQLDEGARRWMKLLADPCGADITHPLYGGTGSGYLSRFRFTVDAPSAATDFVFSFNPSVQWGEAGWSGWADAPGGVLGNAQRVNMPGWLVQNSDAYRIVASCLRVVYTGSAMECSGRVGYVYDPSSQLLVNIGTDIKPDNAKKWLQMTQQTSHLSSGNIEGRWLPAIGDEMWLQDISPSFVAEANFGSSLTCAITGAPAGKWYIECTCVVEWSPRMTTNTGALTGLIETPTITRSRNTVNHVLSTIEKVYGGLVAFATDPSMMGVAKAAYQVLAPHVTTVEKPSRSYLGITNG